MHASTLLLAILCLSATLLAQTAAPPEVPARRPRPVPVIPDGVKVHRDLPYVAGGHQRQELDLYLPEKADGPLPLIIWIHGGAWRSGSKEGCPAVRFTAEGYAVASVNYRLSQHAIFPAQINDCKAAVRWLRAHANEYRLDPKRFGAWGSSAGGHLVALLATTGDTKGFDVGDNLEQSSRVQAVVDFFGPTDLLTMGAQSSARSAMDHDAPDSPESKLIGAAVQKAKAEARRASPITYVSADDPPILIVHGDADPLVPYQQSISFHEALLKNKVHAELEIVKGAGHGNGFGPGVNDKVKQFLAVYLKGQKQPQ